jgi:hypothetical protein
MLALLSLIPLRNCWHRLIARAFDPYRPERHYMRGPGPKWHAKQSHSRRMG